MCRTILAVFALLSTLTACSSDLLTRRYIDSRNSAELVPAPKEEFYRTDHILKKNYTVGQHEIAYVGEPILRVKGYDEHKFRLNKAVAPYDISLVGGATLIKIKKGSQYDIIGTTVVGGLIYDIIMASPHDGILLDSEGRVQRRILYVHKDYRHLNNHTFQVFPAGAKLDNANIQRKVRTKDHFNYELRYDGANQKNFYMTYMEFVPDTSEKVGYFENFTFSKGTPNVNIHGISIRIINAERDKIEFMVLNAPSS